MKAICPQIDGDVFSVLSCEAILDQVKSAGGTGRLEMQRALAHWKSRLAPNPDR
jgi:argininosuccinate lyase